MLDKSLPQFLVALEKFDASNFTRHELPDGYRVCMYEPNCGYEDAFARMETECGQFADFERAKKTFHDNFLCDPLLDPRERCLFIRDSKDEIMATCSMWRGHCLGGIRPRMHWLIVGGGHEGKGIARALVTQMLDLHQRLDGGEYLYLNTGTWNYHAINIYLQYGFKPYLGKRPPFNYAKLTDEEYEIKNRETWNMLFDKMNTYNKGEKYVLPEKN